MSSEATIPQHERATVAIAALVEQERNPNRMPAHKFEALKALILRFGFLQELTVHKLPDGRFRIVDGHHRKRACSELGIAEVPVVIFEDEESAVQALQIGMNHVRGDLDLGDTEAIIRGLMEDGWSTEELKVTGMTDDELTDLLAASQHESDEDLMQGGGDLPDGDYDAPSDKPFILEVHFTKRADLQLVRRKLKKAGGPSKDMALGLLAVLGETDAS